MAVITRMREAGWPGVGIFLAIALAALAILVLLLKKSAAAHLTVGSAMVMLIYLTLGAFLILAARFFVPGRP